MNKIEKYRSMVDSLTKKIVDDFWVERSDIDQLVTLYKLCGITEDTIATIHKGCNFENWDDYILAKRRNEAEQWEFIECVDENLQNVTNKVLNYTSSMSR
jgi:hypothetical protein